LTGFIPNSVNGCGTPMGVSPVAMMRFCAVARFVVW